MGKGGYSEVYKGELEDGEMVAVKKLTKGSNEEKREREFLTEIGTIGHACHPNVSSLLGCCIENGLYLLFPFSPRGSVASLLHGNKTLFNTLIFRINLLFMLLKINQYTSYYICIYRLRYYFSLFI